VRSSIQYWNFGFQIQIPVSYTINPGDSLSVHCSYDTSKYGNSPPYWGETSSNEMCMVRCVVVRVRANRTDVVGCCRM